MTRIIPFVLVALLLATTEASAAGLTKGRPITTGQTTSYGPGSDGDLQKGLSPMFNDLGNGVIKDQRTGLFWEKKSDDGSIHDVDNTYSWSSDGDSMNGTMVTTFLTALNTPPCLGGFCDWRIPNIRELLTLLDYETVAPRTFTVFDDNCSPGCLISTCSCTRQSNFWTSSTVPSFGYMAYHVDFGSDFAFGYAGGKSQSNRVRAVRGGS